MYFTIIGFLYNSVHFILFIQNHTEMRSSRVHQTPKEIHDLNKAEPMLQREFRPQVCVRPADQRSRQSFTEHRLSLNCLLLDQFTQFLEALSFLCELFHLLWWLLELVEHSSVSNPPAELDTYQESGVFTVIKLHYLYF